VLYEVKLGLLRRPRISAAVRRLTNQTGSADRLPEYVRAHAPGKSFADIGCMWNVHGAYTFAAEEAGATSAVGVDVFGPTPEFEAEHARRGSEVTFVNGDITDPATAAEVGTEQVVLCAGVLYHHPSPHLILEALRRICTETLISQYLDDPRGAGPAEHGRLLARPAAPAARAVAPRRPAAGRHLRGLRPAGGLRQLVLGDDAVLRPGAAHDRGLRGRGRARRAVRAHVLLQAV
jgi:hypothetical protein